MVKMVVLFELIIEGQLASLKLIIQKEKKLIFLAMELKATTVDIDLRKTNPGTSLY